MVTPKPDYVYGGCSAEWKHPKKQGHVIVRVDRDATYAFEVRSYTYSPYDKHTIQGRFDTFEDACIFAQTLIDTGAVQA